MGKRKYNLEDNFFDVVSPTSSYWAGFIAADGYVHKCGRKLELHISVKDLEHLECFRRSINFNGPIHMSRTGIKLILSSKNVIDSLYKHYSITNAKTYTLEPPNIISPTVIFPFIAGYIDGDGSIGLYKNYPYLNILGTKHILDWIKCQFDFYLPIMQRKWSKI